MQVYVLLRSRSNASRTGLLDHGIPTVAEAEKEGGGGVTLTVTYVGLATVHIPSALTPTQVQGSCLWF